MQQRAAGGETRRPFFCVGYPRGLDIGIETAVFWCMPALVQPRLTTAVLAVAAAACISEPPGPALNQIRVDAPPVTLDWVGNYQGTASGVFRGVREENVPFQIRITFDQPALASCAHCITVRLDEFFSGMNLLPQTPISARWSYVDEGQRATLTMEKFSSSAVPGTVFFGTVGVAAQKPDGTLGEPTTAFDFVAERQ